MTRLFQPIAKITVLAGALAMGGPAFAGAGPASAPRPRAPGGEAGQAAPSSDVTTAPPPAYDTGAMVTPPPMARAAPVAPAPAPVPARPLGEQHVPSPAPTVPRPITQVADPEAAPPVADREIVPSARAVPRRVPDAGQPTTESYGGQIVMADVAGLLLTIGVGNLAGSSINALVVAPYLFASPLIHLIHGHPGRFAPSLLLHVTAPVIGLLTGLLIGSSNCSNEEFCGVAGAAVGFLAGLATATTIDAAVLAHRVPLSKPAYRASLTPTFSVARATTAGGANASVGLAGQF